MAEVPHILSSQQFGADNLGDIFERTALFKRILEDPARSRNAAQRHLGRKLITLFYEPSTRTRLSFESAAASMGMNIVSTENAGEFSSAIKGETIEDSASVVSGYGEIIVMRHPEPNSVARAAAVSGKPIINAGDGGNEHPTQAVLDAFTIQEHFGSLDGKRIAFGGDLRFGRTVRSLAELISRIDPGTSFSFIAPEELQLSDDIKNMLQERGVDYEQTDSRDSGIKGADVVYWTRLQEERLVDPAQKAAIEKIIARGSYSFYKSTLRHLTKRAIILHPLPRNGIDRRKCELKPEVDSDPRAHYFKQAHNGVPVRQVLMDRILRGVHEQAS